MGTFWDFAAGFYDLTQKANGTAYKGMLQTVKGLVPQGATVLDTAAGTGAISLAVAEKAGRVLCTDISEKMLNVARKKAHRQKIGNVTIEIKSIFELKEPDNSFEVVIAGQVLHLIDEPEKAAAELRRVAQTMVILPITLTKNLRGTANFGLAFYRLFGFAPKIEFTFDEYKAFLSSIGFDNCEHIQIAGKMPMVVAVWRK